MARVLGRYEVGPTLGTGLQGKVKLGTDVETGAKVALKLLDAAKIAARPKERTNLEREIAAMEKLSHDNVLCLREVVWDMAYPKKDGTKKRDVIMIVLDLAEGGELFDFMMYTGCFPESIARAYFQQLVAGMEHCHSNGVTHRDLKPENLLLDASFTLKIADFGLSALLENEDGTPTLLRTECGTRGYMAPEVLAGAPYRGAPADIWSAGVILFITLAGFPPFQIAQSTDWWFQRIRNRQYGLFWEAHLRSAVFSEGAMALLNKIFVADPGSRATLEDIKADPWFAAETVPTATLGAELARRKEEVERQKRLAKAEEDRKKEQERRRKAAAAAAAGGGAVFDPFARDVHRSLGGDDGGEGEGAAAAAGAGAESKAAEEEAAFTGKPAPELPTAHDKVARYTCFYTKQNPAAIQSRLSQAFSAMCAGYKADEDSYKTKATVTTPSGSVQLTAKVFQVPASEAAGAGTGYRLVDITRRQGDLLKFQEVYKVLCQNLADVIAPPPGEEAEGTGAAEGAAGGSGAAAAAAAGGGDADDMI